MYCQRFLGMHNKGGAPVLVMGHRFQMYVMLSVFASGEFEFLRNPSEGFSVFNTGDEDGIN